ncbi:hypothetical protein DB347_13720 [Opitutaceae bacterium EW11]|nr:hypothetical protein DB347_13720 [Opitutaceae bacterium EW11]
MAPPRLLFSGLSLGIDGGMGVYTRRLLHALERRSPLREYSVLLPESHQTLARGLPESRILWVPGRCPVRHALGAEIWWQQRIGRYAAEHHADDAFVACTDFCAFRHPRRAYVVIHDGLAERRPADAQRPFSPRRLWRHWCMRWAARRATAVLTVSAWSASELSFLAGIPGEKIRVSHPWLDATFTQSPSANLRQEARQTYKLPSRYWFYIGGFRAYKNVERLLAAYARLLRSDNALPLVIGGTLPSAAKATRSIDPVDTARRLGIPSDRVVFTGPVSDRYLPAIYAEAELFVFPSMYEGFGYPPVEARGVGTPVIAARAASLPEVLGPKLCCFSPDNLDDLTSAWARAAAAPEAFRQPLDEYFSEQQGIERWLSAVDGPALAEPARSAEA